MEDGYNPYMIRRYPLLNKNVLELNEDRGCNDQ